MTKFSIVVFLLLFLQITTGFYLSSYTCSDEIFPLLKRGDYLKYGYIDTNEYLILCEKIIGCLWGVDAYLEMTSIQREFLHYLISNQMDGAKSHMIFHENFLNDWGPKGKLLTKIFYLVSTLPKEVEFLRLWIKSDDLNDIDAQDLEVVNNFSKKLAIELFSDGIITKEKYKSFFLQILIFCFEYDDPEKKMSYWQQTILSLLIDVHMKSSSFDEEDFSQDSSYVLHKHLKNGVALFERIIAQFEKILPHIIQKFQNLGIKHRSEL